MIPIVADPSLPEGAFYVLTDKGPAVVDGSGVLQRVLIEHDFAALTVTTDACTEDGKWRFTVNVPMRIKLDRLP